MVKNGPETSGEPKGVFYFGHTVMLAATMGAMGLTESEIPFVATSYQQMMDRKFRTSLVGPFGGNLILVLYRYLFTLFLNVSKHMDCLSKVLK